MMSHYSSNVFSSVCISIPSRFNRAPFLGTLALSLVVAWLTVLWQTKRAAQVVPATVLRYE
jgi:ABC-type lipoprotein release transport system permease subunit